jgi:HD-like signal output (HDOD) protein
MTTIVFVDDEQSVLDTLESWVMDGGQSWQAHFVLSAEEALQTIAGGSIDCIVSDMRMPGMNGAELLNQVAELQPTIVRIGFSGYLDAEMTLESLHATHRFIAKPSDKKSLIDAIDRSLSLRAKLSNRELRKIITGITSIPVLPEIYDKLMIELASEDFSIITIGNIIEADISLSATLLKVVNSPYYGLVQHVESPAHATNLLGVEVVKNILLTEKVVSQFAQYSTDTRRVSELNIQASIRGVLANRFAKLAALDKRSIDHSHIAGMMSSLGELVVETGMIPSTEIHAEHYHNDLIGSSIIGLWSLPDSIVEAVLHQSDKEIPTDQLSAMLILHAVRSIENVFRENEGHLDNNFTVENTLSRYDLPAGLAQKWFDCFCDYQLDLRQAA